MRKYIEFIFFVKMEIILLAILLLSCCLVSNGIVLDKSSTNSIKGVLPILIILHHCAFFVPNVSEQLTILHQLGGYVVGSFMFISAYGMFKQIDKISSQSFVQFLQGRLSKVIVPFFIISLLFQLVVLMYGDWSFELLVQKLCHGNTDLLLPHSWYCFDIICLYLFTWFGARYIKHPLFAVLFGFIIFSFVKWKVLEWDRVWYERDFSYVLGALLALKVKSNVVDKSIWRLYVCVTFCTFFLYKTVPHHITLMFFIAMAGSGFVIAFCSLPERWKQVVSYLSPISYEIYLFQGFSIKRFYWQFQGNEYLYFFLVIFTTLLLAIAYRKCNDLLKSILNF